MDAPLLSALKATTIRNSFINGDIEVDFERVSSPSIHGWGLSPDHEAAAIDQDYQAPGELNYYRVFNDKWTRGGTDYATTRQISITPDADRLFQAEFLKQFNIGFQNSFVGVGNVGVMNINGTEYNLPASAFPVLETHSITASAGSQGYNGIEYIFDHWSDSYPYSYRTILPDRHESYTAFFVGRPLQMWHYGLRGNSTYGEQVTLYLLGRHGNGNRLSTVTAKCQPHALCRRGAVECAAAVTT